MPTAHALVLAASLGLAMALPAQLAGPYTVGPGGTFPNMTAAISMLTTIGVAGPCSFLVTANDTGPWTIGAFTGMGTANPVTFDGQGTVIISGTQPVLTLNGCASVTFRGFNGTFAATPSSIVVAGSTTNCVFTGCNLQAAVSTAGNVGMFSFTGGSNCRIEDSTFGGSWEALTSALANDTTTVQRCRITSGGFRIMTISGSNFVLENNFITGTANYGINAGAPGAPATAVNIKIRHNSVFIAHPVATTQLCSLRWYTNTTTSEVVNNIFYDQYPTLTTGVFVFNVWCSGALRPAVMNYNCFWSNQAGYVPFFAGANQTLAGWQALGFDVNSIQADPQYVLPTLTPPLLQLMNTSPCATAGTATVPQIPTDLFHSMRTAPYSMGAHEECGGLGASYAVFGGGCASHAGVPSNSASSTPRLGTSSVLTLGNLPQPNVALLVFGFSNTISGIGPLPVQLTMFGAPGCSARVSLDASAFLVGAGGSASYTMNTPNNPLFTGMQLHTQGLVLDPGLNALGGATSDAATATVGL